ncbi:Arylsulfatase [Tsuneonella dongtanensis]|uniref:Arylsulfatase n=1 Tax=Tsuneonella dongtanensis TaxID=692370 RepID=A0A1B2A9A5_9SPHN|nr:sulfatase-like hydrolase/transferase [Tsuneonella dongtanensis]ANY18635.1 Arylsulfatase [Tsuneonella dongtanensis]
MTFRRREIVSGALGSAFLPVTSAISAGRSQDRPPNIIVFLADDLGWADLSCYGSRLVRTPRIDRLAFEGVRLTNCYAGQNLCSPSRAALLTGRYAIRAGLANEVVMPNANYGMRPDEVTIASLLQRAGYATALIGKWHLGGARPEFLPQSFGFEYVSTSLHGNEGPRPLTLLQQGSGGHGSIEIDPRMMTASFNASAHDFIQKNHHRPFFLYLPYTAPHLPLDPHPAFKGKSWAHAFGDVVEEMDTGVGAIIDQLAALGIDDNTLIIFTSDNGPWFEGSAGELHGRKGSAGYEGGYRVPFIVRYPKKIRPGRISDSIAMGIDILPTALGYAGVSLPEDREFDGRNIADVLENGAPSPHEQLILFDNAEVAGIRTQRWKLVRRFNYRVYAYAFERQDYPPLFDMLTDPSESYNAAQSYPEIWEDMKARSNAAVAEFAPLRDLQLRDPVSGA